MLAPGRHFPHVPSPPSPPTAAAPCPHPCLPARSWPAVVRPPPRPPPSLPKSPVRSPRPRAEASRPSVWLWAACPSWRRTLVELTLLKQRECPAAVAERPERRPENQGSPGCRLDPWPGHTPGSQAVGTFERQPVDVSLPHFPSKINKTLKKPSGNIFPASQLRAVVTGPASQLPRQGQDVLLSRSSVCSPSTNCVPLDCCMLVFPVLLIFLRSF